MEIYATMLFCCYAVAGLLMVLYFAWEDAPCHYSRRVESFYLCFVLSFLYLCTVKFGLDYLGLWGSPLADDHVTDPIGVLRGLQTLRHLMLIFVLIYLSQKFVVSTVLPTFYGQTGRKDLRREAKLWKIATQHPKAVRVAGEVSDQVHSIISLDSGLGLEIVSKGTGVILLLLIMLSEFTVVCKGFWHATVWLGRFLEVVIVIVALHHIARRALLLGSRVEALNELLEGVVKERKKPYLTYILATVSVATLMEVSKHMLGLLTRRALEEDLLDTTSKAILIDALQKAGLRSMKRQQGLARIITSTHGGELTKLKNLIDGRGGYHNLYKLVYQDIANRSVQQKVLQHLEAEAEVVLRTLGAGDRGVKVLSDLDDTLFCSGGKFPAGCDRRYPKGVVYPGCLSLFKVLDKTFLPHKPSCNLVFLSARPHVYKEWMEEKSYHFFEGLAEQERIHTFPTLLPGQLSTGLKAMLTLCCRCRNKTTAWRDVGMHKYETFRKFVRLYPEYDFVFCGDDGQGDLLAAQYMLDEEGCLGSDTSDTEDDVEESAPLRQRLNSTRRKRGSFSIEEDAARELEAVAVSPRGSSDEAAATSQETSQSSGSASSGGGRRRRTGRGRLRAVLIHQVVWQEEDCAPLAREHPDERGEAWLQGLRRRGLIFHRSYVGAATELHASHPDLVSLEDLQSVARGAIREFEEVRLMYPEMLGNWEESKADLIKDLERANEVLHATNCATLRRPRGTIDIEDSSDSEQPDMTRETARTGSGSTHLMDAAGREGGLAGAGELRNRFVDLMSGGSKPKRARHARHTWRLRTTASG